MYSKLNLDEFLARYNNDYDEIWFKKKGDEDFISYTELVSNYDLSILWVYEFGLDQMECLYIVFEEKI